MSKMIKIESCLECDNKHDYTGRYQFCYKANAIITDCVTDRTIHQDCPLPDYVDVEKLQKERDELVKALKDISARYQQHDRGYSDYNQGFDDALIECSDIADEALAKIKGEI